MSETQYLKPIASWVYRHNGTKEGGRITDKRMYTPPNSSSPRLCYEVTYSDGFKDMVAVSSVENGSYCISEKP